MNMEGFFSLIDKLLQSFIWKSVLSHFQWVDWFTIVFILVGIIYGAKTGFFRVLVEILEMFGIIFLVLRYQPPFYKYISRLFTSAPQNILRVGSFLLISIGLFVAMRIVDKRLSQLFHTKLANPFRNVGGAVLGIFYALLIWSFFSQALLLGGSLKIKKIYESGNSVSGYKVKILAPALYNTVTRAGQS